MNVPANAASELAPDAQAASPAALPATRPLYWSVRRELWENRSLYLAPLAVAAVVLLSFLVSAISLPRRLRLALALDPARLHEVAALEYRTAESVILLTGFLVGMFYCLDALAGERRDRSILFWKSMPVSDRTAVLAKASIPLAVLPLLTFAVALATQLLMLLLATLVLLGNGLGPATLWSRLPLFETWLITAYGLTAHVLWYAPIYGWLLLVSAWARRATLLWAVLPFVAISAVEKVALGTAQTAAFLKYRLGGALTEAFAVDASKVPITRFSHLDPIGFLSTPGLWAGLAFAAACLAAAVRLRRHREPV